MSISGKFIKATYGAGPTTIAGTFEWTCQETADRLEATAGSDNGRGKKDVGVIDTKFRVRFYFDATTGVATFIRTGTNFTSFKLFARAAATNPIYAFTNVNVFDFNIVGQVRDRIIVDVDLEAYGDVITFTDAN